MSSGQRWRTQPRVAKLEFSSGRAMLRELLGTKEPISFGLSRVPRLPHGAVRSLVHDREVVLAVVTPDPAITRWASTWNRQSRCRARWRG